MADMDMKKIVDMVIESSDSEECAESLFSTDPLK